MTIFVIEVDNGIVKSVAYFPMVPGSNARLAAENYAKNLCDLNGIIFEGDISCDGSVNTYSVQILEQ